MIQQNWIWLIVLVCMGFVLFRLKPKRKGVKRSDPVLFLQDNLQVVANAGYSKRKLMNKEEYKLYLLLFNLLEEQYKGRNLRLFCQVSMGEFIRTEDSTAFGLINSKRVDFLIINAFGDPIIVIEYQGKGHFQKNAIERDAIKKEACRKADIYYLEFTYNYTKLEIEQRISHILNAQ